MSLLTYSHTLVAGTPENVNDVQDMFNDVKTLVNGNLDAANLAASAKPATLMGRYSTVSEALFSLTNASPAGTYVATTSSGDQLVGTANGIGQMIFPVTLADYAVPGLTTQFRVQVAMITNTVAPAMNFTYALQQVATVGGAAAQISVATVTLAGATVTRTAPAASSTFVDATADFSIVPASSVYVLTATLSGTPAASSNTIAMVRLQVHNI